MLFVISLSTVRAAGTTGRLLASSSVVGSQYTRSDAGVQNAFCLLDVTEFERVIYDHPWLINPGTHKLIGGLLSRLMIG